MMCPNTVDRIAEVLLFNNKRLTLINRIASHCPLTDTPKSCHLIPLNTRRAVFVERQVRHRSIGDQGPLLSNDNRRAIFIGRKPVDLVVDQDAIIQTTRSNQHIFIFAPRTIRRLGKDCPIPAPRHPLCKINVVRCQILHYADVGNARRER